MVTEGVGYISYLHLLNESSEVVGRLVCVLHNFKIIHICSSAVPVYYYDIHVFPGQQHLYDVMQPHWRRSRWPIPMNDEGGWYEEVKLGAGGQVGVGYECTTGAISPGVQQQPYFEVGANDCVIEIQICKFITSLS